MRNSRVKPPTVCRYGVEKYGSDGSLVSSAGRGWSGLWAELRSHSGVTEWKGTQPATEICVDIHGSGSVVERQGGGIFDRTVAERGTIWLSPAGRKFSLVELSEPVPGIMHMYLSTGHFAPDSVGIDLDTSVIGLLRHESGFQDPLVAQIAYAIASELQTQTSSGRLLAETLASTLAVRLVQNHVSPSCAQAFPLITQGGLDRRRLSRVLDYIANHLEGDLTLDHLASISRLSRFHFARAFKAATGQPPHRYVSAKRLTRAKALLVRGDRSLVDIALALNFSCQANFTRAFRRGTGLTPGQYRKTFGLK